MAHTELSGVSNATDGRSKESGDARGRTTITDDVVATIAGIAVRETEGVHSVGRGASKALGAVTGRVYGSSGARRAVQVEVGEKQAAIDLDIEVEYGIPIRELAGLIRTHVTDAVETMTGLEVVEINIVVSAVHVPDSDEEDEGSEDRSAQSSRSEPRVQ
ncbi:Asp23/Gls24 family envelope stress response protein [Streptomyces parvus]|uniref:Asp23/Gls24 family envelope stress response protein n=1 Tax=Streptomyces parvus TaxID=66428 RepID=UPI00365413EA